MTSPELSFISPSVRPPMISPATVSAMPPTMTPPGPTIEAVPTPTPMPTRDSPSSPAFVMASFELGVLVARVQLGGVRAAGAQHALDLTGVVRDGAGGLLQVLRGGVPRLVDEGVGVGEVVLQHPRRVGVLADADGRVPLGVLSDGVQEAGEVLLLERLRDRSRDRVELVLADRARAQAPVDVRHVLRRDLAHAVRHEAVVGEAGGDLGDGLDDVGVQLRLLLRVDARRGGGELTGRVARRRRLQRGRR
ncbi:hypothetical protein [Streptomyces hydrogenans]|uniref:hypothetical protein n=1 Tax=Streptomyces hydrogenans TaxID=1873719 RepID=UPI001CFC4943|nr:hypothetical protein [Streptomyces hydrogenans]